MKNLNATTLLLAVVLFPAFILAQASSADQKTTVKTENKSEISDLWLNTVWKSIDEVTAKEKSFEVEKVTTVAGVRGAEAEDEATKHLYYRGSIRTPTREELHETIKKLETIIESAPTDKRVPELVYYISQCYLKLGNEKKASEADKELKTKYPNSKWARMHETVSVEK